MERMESIIGSAWIFGDNIDTDSIYPGKYLHIIDPKEMAQHAFEFIKPEFKERVQVSDIIIAGKNFGCGSSREHAPASIKSSGIGAILALSFGRIFYRNAINIGLPVYTFDIDEKTMVEIYSSVFDGDDVELHFDENRLEVYSSGASYKYESLPENLQEIIASGGLVPYLKSKIGSMDD